jgi:hypothetical protein
MVTDVDLFLGRALILLGALGLGAGVGMAWRPAGVRRGLEAFPRSRWPGWILTAVAVFWVAWVVQHAALGRFEFLKPFLPFAAMALLASVVFFLDELLAPRALGGLLLLVANPLLMGVRWADSAWRLVPALIAYAWVVAGCALMLHPWLFRRACRRLCAPDAAVRRRGWIQGAGGAALLAAGLWHLV